MDPFAQAAQNIIKEQQAIIGPLAVDQARKVSGLQVKSMDEVIIVGNKSQVLSDLVNQYAKLFGKASVEICKDAFNPFSGKIPQGQIPDILKN